MGYRYRDAGIYDVSRGEVWRVGPHLFTCGDVVEDEHVRALLTRETPDLLYADPPWSNGQAKQFRTLSDLPEAEYDWTAVFAAVLRLPTRLAYWIISDRYRMRAVRELLPRPVYKSWALPGFSTPRVVGVLHYSGAGMPPGGASLSGTKDQKLPERIIARYGGEGLIHDPVSGLGITSRCAAKLGWRSVNNELSPTRVSAALRKMEKLIGAKPVREA